MKICTLIAEFNPLHLGHKYLMEKIRESGASHIVVIMSGNFVQRGEPAIFGKKSRVQAALLNGANLVIELPTVYALATAEKYAENAVFLANALGCAEILAFGSECGNLKSLEKIAETLSHPEFSDILKKELSTGITFAKARENTLYHLTKDRKVIENMRLPNNILAVEYLKALKKTIGKIVPFTVKRQEFFKGASQIRDLICSSKSIKNYVPESSYEIIQNELKDFRAPASLKFCERAILSKLRTLSPDKIKHTPDVTEGIENLIFKAVKSARSIDELLKKIKSKRYTLARLKRIILCAYLGITAESQNFPPPYIRILGADEKGLEILKKAQNSATLPIISKYSQIKNSDIYIRSFFEKECMFTDIYNLMLPRVFNCGEEQSFQIIKD